jgi:hypothetical protein
MKKMEIIQDLPSSLPCPSTTSKGKKEERR